MFAFQPLFLLLAAVVGVVGAPASPVTVTIYLEKVTPTPTTAIETPVTPVALIDAGIPTDYAAIKAGEDFKLADFGDIFGAFDSTTPELNPHMAPVQGLGNVTAFIHLTNVDYGPTRAFLADDPGDVTRQVLQYNREHPQNHIPHFVICVSSRGRPHMYTRSEIYQAIRLGLHDLASPANPQFPGWPRALGFRRPAIRPAEVGEATGRLFEYPMNFRVYYDDLVNHDRALTRAGMVDRVVFDTDGLFAGILRFHDNDYWHYCYPEGFSGIFHPRRPMGGDESAEGMQDALNVWVNEFNGPFWVTQDHFFPPIGTATEPTNPATETQTRRQGEGRSEQNR
ncbi:uncharacterized protein F4822DRAFT_440312 [Hypoxylon trugodes]|uniref:uncharacterized protein n=1 Tax=Hypoxylon trugodes TaxID=326681 RepID=UPI00219D4941|nr:uncharacterized protein F4822DRAFT_440312 [Hypoxylon trugodes]KAI1384165.1 hypothetical protein F4822DRAFT_440312 [Hypoxylon trugodes]